ncbi:MAG: lytic transglycosylase domain-containing protein [Deltaproteobacteria bacterium]|nr:lytic transglycosylase domain-containing protein [Deltaproteobacteria bacterium]MBW2361677.1 lytic transglycosylase domain-containing protein [Deltaproteobacteria bacterium]
MRKWLQQTLRRRRRRQALRRALRGAAALVLLAGPLLALAAALLAGPALAGGRIWTYTDDSGVVHFTNVPQDRRYRPVPDDDFNPSARAPRHWQYDGIIGLTAREHRVQPALVKAVIAAESNFDSEAVSHKGAQGLMQLMPSTAAALGVGDPFRPIENVRGGTAYLRQMLDRYGDVERAVAAYNAGPTAVDRFGGIPPYRETRDYVRRVLAYYRHYHGDFSR